MIKEIIVVEGKDDAAAVRKAVDAEIIITGGFALRESVMKQIQTAANKRGVIIFTDPDFAGEKIRKIISSKITGCKHAFLPKQEATKDGDIGIENARPESILSALQKIRIQRTEKRDEFTQKDLLENNLIGTPDAVNRRTEIGKILGIGYGNAKQVLNRLNNYNITREEWNSALEALKSFGKQDENG